MSNYFPKIKVMDTRRLFFFVKIILAITILAILFWSIDTSSFNEIKVNWLSLDSVIVLFLLILSLLPRALRWQYLMNDGIVEKVSISNSFRFLLVGSALNLVMPAGAGDVAKSYFGYKWTGIKERMVSVSLYDKLVAIASLAILSLYALVSTKNILFLGAAASIVPWLIIQNYNVLIKWKWFDKLNNWGSSKIKMFDLAKLRSNLTFSSHIIFTAFVLSTLGWLLDYTLLYFCFQWVEANINLTEVFYNGPLLTLGRLFPFTLNGIGSDESIMIFVFSGITDSSKILVAALLYRFIIMILPALPGIYYLYATRQWKSIKP
jgi:glycosyltransferase 2 family protein